VREINSKIFFFADILFLEDHLRLESSCIQVNTVLLDPLSKKNKKIKIKNKKIKNKKSFPHRDFKTAL